MPVDAKNWIAKSKSSTGGAPIKGVTDELWSMKTMPLPADEPEPGSATAMRGAFGSLEIPAVIPVLHQLWIVLRG
jgi:hypothetical protein